MRFLLRAQVGCLLSAALLSSSTTRLYAQTASIAGTVIADSSEHLIAQALVELTDLKLSTRTDSLGSFLLKGIQAGTHQLTIRIAGYDVLRATVTLRSGQKLDAEFVLNEIVTEIAKVNVTAEKQSRFAFRLHDFESRRARHSGNYLTADLFDKHSERNLGNVLAGNLPGVDAVATGGTQVLTTHRLVPRCPVQVIVNGASMFNGQLAQPQYDLNQLYTGDVIGVEFYTIANTPPQFNAPSGKGAGSVCGTVVIWTK